MNEPGIQWQLPRGQVQRLAAAPAGRWLAVTAGRLWLTRSGAGPAREADVWVDAGARQWLPPRTDWVAEGWGDAAFLLLQAPPAQRRAA